MAVLTDKNRHSAVRLLDSVRLRVPPRRWLQRGSYGQGYRQGALARAGRLARPMMASGPAIAFVSAAGLNTARLEWQNNARRPDTAGNGRASRGSRTRAYRSPTGNHPKAKIARLPGRWSGAGARRVREPSTAHEPTLHGLKIQNEITYVDRAEDAISDRAG